MSVFRAFIALDLSPEVLEGLSQVLEELREEIGDGMMRWTPIENLHLTLKFLGDVSSSNVNRLIEIIQTAASAHQMFAFSVGGLGAFPSPKRARVLWAGVEGPPELMAVQRTIDIGTARLGYVSESRPFRPHLTLGRVSRNAGPKDFQKIYQILKEKKVGFLGVAQAKELHLFRSDLRPSGAVYSRIYSVNLSDQKMGNSFNLNNSLFADK
jgi:RNA 2',3'-cyclic 3'-phosphodiesterase